MDALVGESALFLPGVGPPAGVAPLIGARGELVRLPSGERMSAAAADFSSAPLSGECPKTAILPTAGVCRGVPIGAFSFSGVAIAATCAELWRASRSRHPANGHVQLLIHTFCFRSPLKTLSFMRRSVSLRTLSGAFVRRLRYKCWVTL